MAGEDRVSYSSAGIFNWHWLADGLSQTVGVCIDCCCSHLYCQFDPPSEPNQLFYLFRIDPIDLLHDNWDSSDRTEAIG